MRRSTPPRPGRSRSMPLPAAALAVAGEVRAQEAMRAIDPPAHGYSRVVIAWTVGVHPFQVAMDRQGRIVGAGDFRAQCVQVFQNLRVALRSAGLDFAHVVRTDMYVTDLKSPGRAARSAPMRRRPARW